MHICYLTRENLIDLRRFWLQSFIEDNSEVWVDENDVILEIHEDLINRIERNEYFGIPDNRLNNITYVAVVDEESNDLSKAIALAQVISTRRGREHTVKIMSIVLSPRIEIADKTIYDETYAGALAYILAYYLAKGDVKGSITKVYAEDDAARMFLKGIHDNLSPEELLKHGLEVAMQGNNWLSFNLLKTK